MNLIHIVAGIVLLFVGRKVYWLLVALTGFVVGSVLAAQLFPTQSVWVALVLGLLVGALGAVLAILISKLAVFMAGFLGGGYLVYAGSSMLGWQLGQPTWLPILIGAIAGGVLMLIVFEWGLMVLSALTGAAVIVLALPLASPARLALAVVLFAIGCLVQIHLFRKS
jgi:hypothetical protein